MTNPPPDFERHFQSAAKPDLARRQLLINKLIAGAELTNGESQELRQLAMWGEVPSRFIGKISDHRAAATPTEAEIRAGWDAAIARANGRVAV